MTGGINTVLRGRYWQAVPALSVRLVTSNPLAEAAQGWLSLRPDQPLLGTVVFQSGSEPGSPQAAVTLQRAGRRFVLPFDHAEGVAQALAVANPAGTAAAVHLSLYSEEGERLTGASLLLPPQGQRTLSVADMMGAAAAVQGMVVVNGGLSEVSVLALRIAANSLSAVPVWPGL